MSEVKVVKQVGLINEKGEIVVPVEYASIVVLKSGVYVAEVSPYQEEEPVPKKYYHHKRVYPIKDKARYHLYTAKGKVEFDEPIMSYTYSYVNDEKIFAIRTPNGYKLVSMDYEKNKLKVHESAIADIVDVWNEYVCVKKKDGGCAVYSIKSWEKLLDLPEAENIKIFKERGFVVYGKITGKTAFYNLSGEMILDYEWDLIEYSFGLKCLKLKELSKDGKRTVRTAEYSFETQNLKNVKFY